MSNDPLKPDVQLLIKLGSLLVHYQEFLSGHGHEFDKITIQQLEKDEKVVEWKKQMDDLALLPLKRNK